MLSDDMIVAFENGCQHHFAKVIEVKYETLERNGGKSLVKVEIMSCEHCPHIFEERTVVSLNVNGDGEAIKYKCPNCENPDCEVKKLDVAECKCCGWIWSVV